MPHNLPLKEEHILNNLKTNCFGKKIYAFQTISSTNDYAKTLIASTQVEEGTLIISDQQTKGRGRIGNRQWQSLPGVGLWFSLIFQPRVYFEKIPLLTYLVSYAVGEALEGFYPTGVDLKWPNDILIGGKKCCGILLESDIQHTNDNSLVSPKEKHTSSVIAGIGINVNHQKQDFTEELQKTATSIRLEKGTTISRLDLLCNVLERIEYNYKQYFAEENFESIIAKWKSKSSMLEKSIKLALGKKVFEGIAANILPDGQLEIIQNDGSKKTFFTGTVM